MPDNAPFSSYIYIVNSHEWLILSISRVSISHCGKPGDYTNAISSYQTHVPQCFVPCKTLGIVDQLDSMSMHIGQIKYIYFVELHWRRVRQES